MRNLKKFLALVLAMMMALSLMVTVNAANVETPVNDVDSVTEEFQEAVQVLNGMGILTGYEDGTFKPAKNVSRAEMTALVYRLHTGDWRNAKKDLYSTVDNLKPFKDVLVNGRDAWSAGYMGYCANEQIIKGVSADRFNPTGNVTGYQALAMVLRAIGYGKNGEFEGTGWQTRVGTTATQLGMLVNIDDTNYTGHLSAPATRELVAEIVFQAAQLPTVRYEMGYYNPWVGVAVGTGANIPNKSLGELYYGLDYATGIVVGNQATGELTTKLGVVNVAGKVTGLHYDYVAAGTNEYTINFNANTGLGLFGHKVKMWFDNRKVDTTNYTTTVRPTYAYIDQAELAKIVYANDATICNGSNQYLGKAAKAAGFNVTLTGANGSTAYRSTIYQRIDVTQRYDSVEASPVHMYSLISNNAGKTLDVVITLNAEAAQITQVNNTTTPKSVILGNANDVNPVSKFGPNTDGVINQAQLTAASTKTLGANVVAWEVIGTTQAINGVPRTDYMYELKAPIATITGTVASYELMTPGTTTTKVKELTFTNGDKYYISGIAQGSGAAVADGKVINDCLNVLTGTNTYVGQTVTLYLDELGRFLGATAPYEYTFLYSTYADYAIGGLGTAELDYYVSGFGFDAKDVDNHIWTSRDNNAMTGAQYKDASITITQKDLGVAGTNGNQIKPGYNTAYMINDAGDLSTTVTGATKFIGTSTGVSPTAAGDIRNWTITAADVANGFKRVNNKVGAAGIDLDYLLTNNTKFIVVSGVGINATATVYNGIGELLGTGTSAEIYYEGYAGAAVVKNNEVWFQTTAQKYSNVITDKNGTIETVILSDTNLKVYNAQTIFFSAPGNVANDVVLNGAPATVRQYKLWRDGVEETYFVNDTTAAGTPGTVAAGSTNGTFWTLTPDREYNGIMVYNVSAAPAGVSAVNKTYNYIVTNDYSTADIGGTVYRVGGAKVAEAFGTNASTVPAHTAIKDVPGIHHAVSLLKADGTTKLYTTFQVAIVYSGADVSCIYVTNMAT